MSHNPQVGSRMSTFKVPKDVIRVLKGVRRFRNILRLIQLLVRSELASRRQFHEDPEVDHHLVP